MAIIVEFVEEARPILEAALQVVHRMTTRAGEEPAAPAVLLEVALADYLTLTDGVRADCRERLQVALARLEG